MRDMLAVSPGLVLRLLRDEGLAAVRNRLIDRWKERSRLRRLEALSETNGRLTIDLEPPPVLNVSPTPPSPKRGGAQLQMLDRLHEEKKLRTVALVYPRGVSWWMEVWAPSHSGIIPLGEAPHIADLIVRAADLAGARVVHLESLSNLPLTLVSKLETRGYPTVLSVHDFTLFCRKPHLIELATEKFCEYCQDLTRCAACLHDVDPHLRLSQSDYRRAAAAAFECARAVVYPSSFMKEQHETLFPGLRGALDDVVIAPATSRRSPRSTGRPSRRRHIAFIGGTHLHKGGALIAPTFKEVLKSTPDTRAFVYGGGGRPTRELLHMKGIRVRGYYRHGNLASLLQKDDIAVGVLPSIWPEAYALVVDECLAAGVPVVAFYIGAVAERLTEWGVGTLAPVPASPRGLADAIVERLSSDFEIPATVTESLPRPTSAARRHIELYCSLTSCSRRLEYNDLRV